MAHLPNLLRIEAAGVSLIDDIGKKISVGDDDLARLKRRPDNLVDKLRRAAIYNSISLRRLIGVAESIESKNLANSFAKRRASRIAAKNDVEAMTAQSFFKQAHLRGFADAVDAVE